MGLVVPAVLPISRNDLREKLDRFAAVEDVTRIQIDVVDGTFATPRSWPYAAPQEWQSMLRAGEMLPYLDRIAYEIDLMCMDAESAAGSWLALGASRLTFHAESILDMPKFLASIRSQYGDLSSSFGIAINVQTDASIVEPYLHEVAYVQFMGIDSIGKQGQPFDRRTIGRLRTFHKNHPDVPMQVDGGVTLALAPELVAAGATNLIVGSALARAADLRTEIAAFEALQTPFGV